MVDLEIDESKVWSAEERQAYADSIPEMSLFEDHIVEGDPMVDAMKALIEEGETNESLAMHWKSKGNEMYQNSKKYKEKKLLDHALKYYSDGLAYILKAKESPSDENKFSDQPIDIAQLASTILCNRAAVHLEKKNYGSCRSDCARAIQFNTDNIKAYFRGAKASLSLKKPNDVFRYCKAGLQLEPENKSLLDLEAEAKELEKVLKKKKQEQELKRMRLRQQTNKYRQLCDNYGVKVGQAIVTDERVREYEGKAFIDLEDGQFRWPVMFIYDEHGTSDFIQGMGDRDSFLEHLANIFPEDGPFCDWDRDEKYRASALDVYVLANVVVPFSKPEEWHVELSKEEISDDKEYKRQVAEKKHDLQSKSWIKISPFCTLRDLLLHPQYVVPGIPIISVVVRDSVHASKFLKGIGSNLIHLKKE